MIKIFKTMRVCVAITGCMYHEAEFYKTIDTSKKSIGMPSSNRYIAGDLKDMFRKNGWKVLLVNTAGVVTTGQTGSDTNLTSKEQTNVSYIVYLNQNRYDICFPTLTDAAMTYDISIIKAKTGEQVFYQEGNGCRSDIRKRLESELSVFFK